MQPPCPVVGVLPSNLWVKFNPRLPARVCAHVHIHMPHAFKSLYTGRHRTPHLCTPNVSTFPQPPNSRNSLHGHRYPKGTHPSLHTCPHTPHVLSTPHPHPGNPGRLCALCPHTRAAGLGVIQRPLSLCPAAVDLAGLRQLNPENRLLCRQRRRRRELCLLLKSSSPKERRTEKRGVGQTGKGAHGSGAGEGRGGGQVCFAPCPPALSAALWGGGGGRVPCGGASGAASTTVGAAAGGVMTGPPAGLDVLAMPLLRTAPSPPVPASHHPRTPSPSWSPTYLAGARGPRRSEKGARSAGGFRDSQTPGGQKAAGRSRAAKGGQPAELQAAPGPWRTDER